RILRCRFIEGKTLKELGETEGAPQSAIRQKQDKALNALRLPKRSRKFKAYYEEYLSPAPIHHVGVGRYMQTWISEVERDALGS
ncbi:MAG: RNA polymerase subunit sigma-70, partial [Hespellia sp.]|nr:RNA polymerase subunit sigma-70 [Hespellia sp.]